MINDDTIVKYSIQRLKLGFSPDPSIQDWVDYTRFLKEQIQYIKLGFTGLGDGDISLISNQQVVLGDRIIIDDNLDSNCGVHNTDHAAIMGVIIQPDQLEITAIGQGYDFTRDPDRILYRPGITIQVDLSNYYTLLRVEAKPRPDGGSLYYFFNKSVLDGRF
jgi:hypothetical protein